MGNLAYIRAFQKQQKTSYKGLDDVQKRYIKAKEKFEQMDNVLNSFYSSAKRTSSGAVDFANMSNDELDAFDFWNKEKQNAMKQMDKLENEIDVDYTLNLFLQINTHSMSF